ncbi:hypothetical protein [Thauera sinica]|uniref:Uncharacterized protein n=1 Tax=Thauera sinica TaxID=2665146 RepID=A0ABW1AP71_9RHOO|nr:hypothetical protein [Thauera sp. K11]ATE58994.1 hypothetical protein CCZ27_02590 [Thauera sp. K11]ATE61142.1 hypothetical protein CCZ27_15410 [Thauera sp. K11]
MTPLRTALTCLFLAGSLSLLAIPAGAEPPAVGRSGAIPPEVLNPRQVQTLQMVGSRVLQAMATERAVADQEAAEERARLAPVKDALKELEQSLTEEVMHPRLLAGGSQKRDQPVPRIDLKLVPADVPVDFRFDPSRPARPLAAPAMPQPAPQVFNWSELTGKAGGRNAAAMEHLAQKQSEARSRIAAARGLQRRERVVADTDAVERQWDQVLERLDALPEEPAQRLAEVRRLRRALEAPEPPALKPSSPSIRQVPVDVGPDVRQSAPRK